ncbi:hypothetical protein ABPG74_012582 [Tetrahymena malaccensis]
MLQRIIRFSFSSSTPMKDAITSKIQQAFKPQYFQIENESHKHSVPKGSETHFKLVIVSDDFSGLSKVQCHQKIYSLLQPEFQMGLHALSLMTKTANEWNQDSSVNVSPSCMGGSKKK